MSLFRRDPKPDPTLPVDPPYGMKWHVAKMAISDEPHPMLRLELWSVDAEIDEFGFAKGHHALGGEPFALDRPRSIRKTSERVISQWRLGISTRQRVAEIQASVNDGAH